jgi:hypothetical protein
MRIRGAAEHRHRLSRLNLQVNGNRVDFMAARNVPFPIARARLLSIMAYLTILVAGCKSPVRPLPADVPTAPPPAVAAPVTSPLPAIRYTIQVGAFSSLGRAARYAERMKSAGLDAYYFVDSDGLYKVRFERFDDKATARRRALALQARGVIPDFFIIHPGPAGNRTAPHERLQKSLVQTAHRFIGVPYRWGGASAGSGFDCSGLTMTVYRLNGLELPRNAYSQYRAGTPVVREGLMPGDLVFFATGRSSRISHVGIYIGGGRFIHAPGRGKRIRTAALSNGYFSPRYKGARRYY